MKKLLVIAVVALLLTACSKSLEGTYSDEYGISKYVFESNGTVYIGAMGVSTELEYEIDGKKLKILYPNGQNQILTLHDDGSIGGPAGIKLVKKN